MLARPRHLPPVVHQTKLLYRWRVATGLAILLRGLKIQRRLLTLLTAAYGGGLSVWI